jgi:trans-aconitate methyltransferase
MSMFASHFGHPRGLIGSLIGRGMARFNGDFNRWVVDELARQYKDQPDRVVELGPGPGVGLEALLHAFPKAHVWGVDLSREMLSQSRKRNRGDAESGRLTLMEGDVRSLVELAPIDLVMANHVLYFWHNPLVELALVRASLRRGGVLALGYQLKQSMPKSAQTNFPKLGHVLYDSDDSVMQLLRKVGFTGFSTVIKGTPDAPEGRLAMATA